MSELSRLQQILNHIDGIIKDTERLLLEGTVPHDNDPAVGWANYRAGVVRRRDLYSLRKEVARICEGLDPDANDDDLEEMPEGEGGAKRNV